MLFILTIFLELLSLTHAQSYTVTIVCLPCSLPGCTQCITYNGGPFTNYIACIPPGDQCTLQNNVPETVEFSCLGSNSTTCTYTDTYQNIVNTGPTVPQNAYWLGLQTSLDQALRQMQNSTQIPDYNWCNGVGTCGSGLSTGAIIGIVFGSIAAAINIVIITICVCKKRKQKKQKSQQIVIALNASQNGDKSLYSAKNQVMLQE